MQQGLVKLYQFLCQVNPVFIFQMCSYAKEPYTRSLLYALIRTP